ncbi:amidase [filamentous cyanobacterium CCP3]|nr:amidase [filamentous cyanobacterium CCP3]
MVGGIYNLTASEAIARLRAAEFSSLKLAQACLGRIGQREPVVAAWQYLDADQVVAQAIACDHAQADGASLGALHGIPVAIKDICATADMPTGWGTPIHAGQQLNYDAAVVERLRAAGAIIMGKTVSTEYALARAGKTKNPHNPSHTPGGSSSGSAAAVADRMVPVAIGTQTGGSVLRPAAYCGVLGFKPSFGAISRFGVMPVCRDLDHMGVFARSLADIVLLCSVLMGADGRDPDCWGADGWGMGSPSDLPKLGRSPRIGFVRTSAWHEVEAEAQAALVDSLELLTEAGATVAEVSMPSTWDEYLATIDVLMACGAAVNHGGDYDRHGEALSPQLRQVIERGRAYGSLAYSAARQAVVDYSIALAPLWAEYDALITPVTTGPAPEGLHNTGSFKFCGPWTLLGGPALSIPVGRAKNQLPLAIQLVGARGADGHLLAVANWVMAQLGDAWRLEPPA